MMCVAEYATFTILYILHWELYAYICYLKWARSAVHDLLYGLRCGG